MKNVPIYIFLICILSSCVKSEPELLKEGVGNRKLLREIKYRPNIDWSQSDSLIYQDSLLSGVLFFIRNKLSSENVFVYQDNKITMYNADQVNGDGFLHELSFNQLNQLQSYKNGDGVIDTYTYSSIGKLSSVLLSDSESSVTMYVTMDSFGNIIEESITEDSITYVDKFTFDDKINPSNGLPSFNNSYAFLNENNIIKSQSIVNGILEKERIYEYEYDIDGYPTRVLFNEDTIYYIY